MRFPRQIIAWGALALATSPAGIRPLSAAAQAVQIPKEATSLEGRPTVRVDEAQEAATRRPLDATEAGKQELKVNVLNGRYFWASRGNQPLTLTTTGDFTYLSSSQPGQYIRLRRLNDRISYVEHLDIPAGHVTYWGEIRIVLGK